jgi:hypothetical protein
MQVRQALGKKIAHISLKRVKRSIFVWQWYVFLQLLSKLTNELLRYSDRR